MAIQEICCVQVCEQIGSGLYSVTAAAPQIAEQAQPGQFVHIACGEGKLLRRPISICSAQNGVLQVVFQMKGEGTKWLSQRKQGDTLDILGPLGKGFQMDKLGGRPVFIGGGIGVPPMYEAMKRAQAQGAKPSAILGSRNKDAVILEEAFRTLGDVYITTDDGSYGRHGFVSDVLKEHIGAFTAVCACGPKGMLRAVAAIAKEAGIPCQTSLEERMGCGIGACLVCACELVGEKGETVYGHVCKDGPVFDAQEVAW